MGPTGEKTAGLTPDAIGRMFSDLAPGYRQFNTWASLGQDNRWRRKVIDEIREAKNVLDVGTGTGELAHLAQVTGASVTGVDISVEMLSLAQRRYGNVRWQQSSAEKLPFLDGSFDAVISAYVMRNLYRGGILPQTLSEARRVLTPTGKLVFLDLTQPVGGFLRWGHRLYNQTVLPLLGRLFFGDRWPKHYLASSIEALPSVDKLREFFLSSGFKSFEFRPLWGGIVSLFIGSRQ